MVVLAFWLIGFVLTLKGAISIWGIEAPADKKIVVITLMTITSWAGLLFYDFYARRRMPEWLQESINS